MLKKIFLLLAAAGLVGSLVIASPTFAAVVTSKTTTTVKLPVVPNFNAKLKNKTIILTWNKPAATTKLTGYSVMRSEVLGTAGKEISKPGKGLTTFTDSKISEGHIYYYSIKYTGPAKSTAAVTRQLKIFVPPKEIKTTPVVPTPTVPQTTETKTNLTVPAPTPTPITTPIPTAPVVVEPTPAPAIIKTSFTLSEVATHKDSTSCWSAVNGLVYDLTRWINSHPGGQGAILSICGVDGSAAFNSMHGGSSGPANILAGFKIGTLE